jgi:hypothetical protein
MNDHKNSIWTWTWLAALIALLDMSKHPKTPKKSPHPDPHGNGGDDKSAKRHVYVEPGTKIDLVEDLKDQYTASHAETSSHNNKQLLLSGATVILLLVTAGFSFWQGFSTKKAADAATSAAKTSSDALEASKNVQMALLALSMSPDITPLKNRSGALIDWNVTIANIGATVATQVNVSSDFIDLRGSNGRYGEPQPIPKPIPNPKVTGDTILPGKSQSYKVPSQIIWWDDVLDGKSCTIVRWNASYIDIFQRPQVSPYCFWYNLRARNWERCPPFTIRQSR